MASFDSEIGGVVFLSCQEKVFEFLNEGVLYVVGVVRRLGDNIGASDGGIGMNSFFPRETDGSKIIVQAGFFEGGPCFGNHFVNGAVTIITVICNWWGLWSVC